ncbi:MAG: sulfotransferase [Pleurocapsa sp. MO_226.B13]|nr:sulfotransferase [Pleurocapsa sp. MO_226.B13]
MLGDWETLESGLFFIVGTGRCGTTLLQSMLSQHSRILVPLEMGFFTNLEPAIHFSDPLSDTQLNEYLRYCTQYWWWPALSINSEAFCEVVRGGMRSARSIFLWLLWQLSAGSGKVTIGEKTIGNWQKVARILELFPKAKFIHIYRDPRDVVVSLKNQDWWIPSAAMPAAMYCRQVLGELKEREQHLSKTQFLRVQYELLVKQPELELRRICVFLGEEFESRMLRFYERKERGYVDAEAEWKDLTLKPLTLKRVGIYREQLKPREIWTVEQMLGELLVEYGYSPDREVDLRLDWVIINVAEQIKWRLKCLLIGGSPKFISEKPVLERLS